MSSANKYAGDVILNVAGRSYRLRYDWNAIGKLVTELGSDFEQEVSRSAIEMDLPVLASVLAIGLERHHDGEFTVQGIIDMSPPIVPVVDAVNKAISFAFHGTTEVPAEQGENPPLAARLLKRLWIPFSKHRKPPIATA